MNNKMAMRVRHRRANIEKERENLSGGKPRFAAILRDAPSRHVLHDDVGQTFGGGAAVKQPGDIRMIQAGENLPFAPETLQDKVGVHAGRYQLDRGFYLVLVIVALGQVHRAHAAAADLANQPVGADPFRSAPGALGVDKMPNAGSDLILNKRSGLLVVLQEGVDLAEQVRVAIASRLDPRAALAGGNVQRLVE